MKRRNPICAPLVALAILFGLWACGGSAAPGGAAGAPGGAVGGGLGGVNQAMPGMDEVPLGPKADPTDKSHYIYLSCVNVPQLAQADSESDNGGSDGGIQAQMITYTLRLFVDSPFYPHAIRIVDKQRGEFRQKLVEESRTFADWIGGGQPSMAAYILKPYATIFNDPKPCPDEACHDADLIELTPCLNGPSCLAYGWNYRDCALPRE